jgi:hypothetical protein
VIRTVAQKAAHSKALRLMCAAAGGEWPAQPPGGSLAAASFGDFQNASRRFVRNLVAILPMLGFLGTVVGLSTTLSDLPAAIGAGATPHPLDLSGALGGLAIKFQTTLLGLLTSMICGFGLALLERRELEFQAECLLVVSVCVASEDPAQVCERSGHEFRGAS